MERKIILGLFAVFALITTAVYLNVVSAQSLSGNSNDSDIVAAPAASATLVISQVYPGGGSSSATVTYKKDYVEIKNVSSTAQSLSGLSLQYGSATGNFGSSATNIYTLTNAGTLAAGQYYLVELGTPGTGGADLAPAANESTINLNMSATSGHVVLTNTPIGLGCGATATLCTLPDPRIIDLVAWGVSSQGEGVTTVNNGVALPANTNGGVRKAAGCTDTDNNNNDFDVVVGPIPRNASSALAPCGAGVSIEKKFRAYLNGSNEVPANASTATGFGRLTLNAAGTQVKASFYFSGLSSNTTAGHIHGASVVGVTSGVIFDMTPPTGVTSGSAVDRLWTTVTPAQVADLKAGLWYFNIHTVNFPGGEIRGQIVPFDAAADFDGDARTDISVFRPSEGNWYVNRSSFVPSIAAPTITNFGISTDTLVPGDYDGDGKTDYAVWRPQDTIDLADYYILNSSTFTLSGYAFGLTGDIPIVGDYDGDGKADLACFRGSANATWYIFKTSGTNAEIYQFGLPGDIPMSGDFNGDGKTDLAVFRPSTRFWFWNNATGTPAQNFGAVQWGDATDTPVAADYDGDGKDDVAVYRPAIGGWFIIRSSDGVQVSAQLGAPNDIPVPGDYDGDGSEDIAVFRPSTGIWYFKNSTTGFSTYTFGLSSDKPIPATYHP